MSNAANIASSLVAREQMRSRSRMRAYHAVASKVGMSAAWVRKLVAGGVKSLNAEVKARLDALLIHELEAELARLQHELDMARQSGAHPASEYMGAIETHLASARALMEGT